MKRYALVAWLFSAVLSAENALAAPVPYTLEESKSSVGFTYQFSGKPTKGTMPVAKAVLLIDVKDITASKIDVTLNPAQARAGFLFATETMKGAKVLDTARFPTARFVARKIKGSLKGAKVTGDLTLRGVTKQVTLDAKLFRQNGTEPGDLQRLSVLLTGQVDRRQFGASGFPDFVGPQISLRILARMRRSN